MRRFSMGLVWFLLVFHSLSFIQGQEKPADPGEIYDAGVELLEQGKYQSAIELFSRLIQSFPSSRLVSYAHYMTGQSFLKLEKYEEAVRTFQYYLKAYPEGDRTKESELGLKMAMEKLGAGDGAGRTKTEGNSAPEAPGQAGEKVPLTESAPGVASELLRAKRRICAQISYIEGRSLVEVERRIKELKHAGVDTLIFRVFQNRGDPIYKFVKARHPEGVYFETEYAPVVDDILGKIADIAKRNGLDLFAWMTTRHATYGIEKQADHRSRNYHFETKKMEIGRGLNLFHPDVLKRLEGLFRDLGRHSIDGILFQDDLILRHNEDFSVDANRAFLKEFGYSPHPDIFYIDPYRSESGKYYVKGYTEQFWTWADWKNRHLMEVAGRLMTAARESNPKLQFAINLYFEAVLNDANGVAWFSQTLPGAMKKGFDYYAIMAYHRQAMKGREIGLKESVDLMAEAAGKAVKASGTPSRVMMKIWILDWKSNEAVGYELAPQKEIEEVLERILGQGEVSLAFVPYLQTFPLRQLKGKWSGSK